MVYVAWVQDHYIAKTAREEISMAAKTHAAMSPTEHVSAVAA